MKFAEFILVTLITTFLFMCIIKETDTDYFGLGALGWLALSKEPRLDVAILDSSLPVAQTKHL